MKIENFGFNLKRLRLEAGLTQQELGKKLGTSQATYGKWEIGTVSPTLKSISRIAEVLDVPLEDLFRDN